MFFYYLYLNSTTKKPKNQNNYLIKGAKMKIDARKLEILQARELLDNKELREKADIGHLTLVQIKQGIRNVQPKTVGKIAKALNCDVVELLED